MAVTRRIGNLTIHFLGDNAEQLAGMFGDAHSRSKTFRRDMDETSRTHRNIYVGSALADLQDQPNFGNAGFDPGSKEVSKPAFGKAAGAETHFIVVKPAPHSLIHDGRRFDGSAQLALVHELLHPSQIIRELAQNGTLGDDTERRTQIREQDISVELGRVPGNDFPDVRGSEAPYDALPDHADPQPNSATPNESAPFVPIGYRGPAHVRPTQSNRRETTGGFELPRYAAVSAPAAEPINSLVPNLPLDAEPDSNSADSKSVRYLGNRVVGKPELSGLGAGAPIAPPVSHENFDPHQTPFNDQFGRWATFQPGTTRQVAPLVGLVSGRPMSFYPVRPPIFDLAKALPSDDENWLMQLLAPRGQR